MTDGYGQLSGILFHWQTLLGSILGGVIALLAALIVAHSQTRRERRAAASLVLTDLMSVEATEEKLKHLSKAQQVDAKDYPSWVAEKLEWRRPKLSSFFEAEVARLLDLHPALSAHLNLFRTIYPSIEESLERLRTDQEQLSTVGLERPPRAPQNQASDTESVAHALEISAAHSRYAQYYLGKLIFGPFPTFSNLRMRAWRTQREKDSLEFLRTGSI